MNHIVVKIEPTDEGLWRVCDETRKLSLRAPPERFPARVRDIVKVAGRAYYRISPGADQQIVFGDRVVGDPGW